jgi:integrase
MNPLPVVNKSGIDILFPSQYQILVDHARDDRLTLMIIILFHSGIRYSELHQIDASHYDKRSGKLRIDSTKAKCKNPSRWVTLTPAAREAVESWISAGFKPMSLQAYNERLGKIARYHGFNVSGKTSRKTYESWRLLLGDDSLKTCVEIGHEPSTAYAHYLQNLPFIDEDIQDIKRIFGRE